MRYIIVLLFLILGSFIYLERPAIADVIGDADRSSIPGRLDLDGSISVALTAGQNNWAPTGIEDASIIEVTANADGYVITGITPGTSPDGRLLTIVNVDTTNYVQIDFESSSSTAANRLTLWTDADETSWNAWSMEPGQQITFIYNSTLSRWVSQNVTYVPFVCEVLVETPLASDAWEFCAQDNSTGIFHYVECECYGTCGTPPTISICKGEDITDDTCTTGFVTSLSCTTGGGSATITHVDRDFSEGTSLSLLITNTPVTTNFLRVTLSGRRIFVRNY